MWGANVVGKPTARDTVEEAGLAAAFSVFAWFFVGRVHDELVGGFGRHMGLPFRSAAILAALETQSRLEAGATRTIAMVEPPPRASCATQLFGDSPERSG